MSKITNQDLIKKAASVIKAKETKTGLFGDVGCALLAANNKMYFGTCTAGANAYCAERSAIVAMITDGEYVIKKIVAVWKNEKGELFVIPPCGNCRQCMREVDEDNLNAEVVLDKDKTVTLKELLPYFDWWKKQE